MLEETIHFMHFRFIAKAFLNLHFVLLVACPHDFIPLITFRAHTHTRKYTTIEHDIVRVEHQLEKVRNDLLDAATAAGIVVDNPRSDLSMLSQQLLATIPTQQARVEQCQRWMKV